jgi:hypothetical protein
VDGMFCSSGKHTDQLTEYYYIERFFLSAYFEPEGLVMYGLYQEVPSHLYLHQVFKTLNTILLQHIIAQVN